MVSFFDTMPACEPVGCVACEPVAVVSVGGMVCHSSSGEPLGCAACAVVSNLDTLPAVSLCRGVGRMVCLWPVDWLPLSVVAGMCCLWLLIGGRWDVLPVAVDWWPLSVSVGCAACGC